MADWIDYSSREPFGFPIDDLRAAMQMAITANAAGATPPYTAEDFQLAGQFRGAVDEEPTEDKLVEVLKRLMPPKDPTPPVPAPE